MKAELDKVDLNILSTLQNDARTPFTKIAESLGVSDATIHLRVRKLEEMGLIQKYTVVLNEEKLGKPVSTYILIRVDPGTVVDVCTKLSEINEVYEVCEIHERYDVLAKIKGSNLEDVRDILIQKIRPISNIVSSEAYTVYKTWKQDIGLRIATQNS